MENIEQTNAETEEESVESSEFESEKALGHEKTLLERFSGKARKIARVMTLVSALSAAPGLVQEAYAQQATPGTKTEQVNKDTINEANVTESGSWAKQILEKAKSELSEVETKEDALAFINANVGNFVREWRFPTKGNIRALEYGGKTYSNIVSRRYSADDGKLIMQSARAFKSIIQDLDSKYQIGNIGNNAQTILDDIIKDAAEKSSYANRKRQELLDRSDKILDEYNNNR